MNVDLFINKLAEYIPGKNVFNPWGGTSDPNYDLPDAPARRKENLSKYLRQRVPNAKYIFVGEALGYQGGRFSGIAMTSERILSDSYRNISSESVFYTEMKFDNHRSSNHNLELNAKVRKQFGFAEPTATTVWTTMHQLGLNPNHIILWNILPFHPFEPEKGSLSNRPLDTEADDLKTGVIFVQALLEMNPNATIIAIGNPAKTILNANNIPCLAIRHPSNGGAPEFNQGLRDIIKGQ